MARIAIETATEDGAILSLFARDGAYEVEVDGRVVLATDRRHADQGFAELALGPWQGRDDITVLLGGLGTGLLLKEILAVPGVVRVDVVEISAAIIDWERRFFATLSDGASADPRVRVHHGELAAFIEAAVQPSYPDAPTDGWSAVVLDCDEHPAWHSRPGNALFYTEDGLRLFEGPLRGGGVLGIWTTEKDEALFRAYHRRLQAVTRLGAAGDQGLIYVHRGRRGPRRAS